MENNFFKFVLTTMKLLKTQVVEECRAYRIYRKVFYVTEQEYANIIIIKKYTRDYVILGGYKIGNIVVSVFVKDLSYEDMKLFMFITRKSDTGELIIDLIKDIGDTLN
ncbi:MAG: hypothetical protein N2712_00740 [Brevinematales bacterium]|nr:hypothetical protein [Brevinematales bacterium]